MRLYRIEQIQSIKNFENQRKTAEFQVWKLIISIAICLGVVYVASRYAAEFISTWYETLRKPSFITIPIELVGLILIVLFAIMGIALYLIWRKSKIDSSVTSAQIIFFVQLSLNFLWIFVLLTSIKFFLVDRLAGYLMIPYLMWVSFASVLNAFIIRLN